VAVTAGYIDAAAREELFNFMDAANVDLKAFTEEFYKRLCTGHLGAVLETLEYLKCRTKVWFEITTLLIPGHNDSPEEVRKLSEWVMTRLGPDVPLHFTAFHPDYKMLDLPRPEARLYKKGDGQPAKLSYMGHALMENRNGLAVLGGVSQATGTAEREIALTMIDALGCAKRITLGADKAYDVTQFVHDLRDRLVTPHIAIDGHLSKTGKRRKTAIDARTTRHSGYDISQRCRKRIEEVFGWIKSSAGLAKVKLRGRDRVDAVFVLALAAYNLIRLPKLLASSA
jgi:hypothetical protein